LRKGKDEKNLGRDEHEIQQNNQDNGNNDDRFEKAFLIFSIFCRKPSFSFALCHLETKILFKQMIH
jgi:hypothetical protein